VLSKVREARRRSGEDIDPSSNQLFLGGLILTFRIDWQSNPESGTPLICQPWSGRGDLNEIHDIVICRTSGHDDRQACLTPVD
jgi:hypothetical protein